MKAIDKARPSQVPVYKVHRPFDVMASMNIPAGSWIATLAIAPNFIEAMHSAVAGKRTNMLNEARQHLSDLGRDPRHLYNLYICWDDVATTAAATYVFSDRDTALLFKLSH